MLESPKNMGGSERIHQESKLMARIMAMKLKPNNLITFILIIATLYISFSWIYSNRPGLVSVALLNSPTLTNTIYVCFSLLFFIFCKEKLLGSGWKKWATLKNNLQLMLNKRPLMIGFLLQLLERPNGGIQLSTISLPWLVLVSLVFPMLCHTWAGNNYNISYIHSIL